MPVKAVDHNLMQLNLLSCLTSMLNDYKNSKPNNLMAAYVYDHATGASKQMVSYESSQ